MKNLLDKGLVFIALLLTLVSCDFSETIFNEYKELPEQGWHKDSVQVFDVTVSDTLTAYQVLINVRSRADFKTQNLWLFVNFTQPDKTVIKDTVECYLADNQGRWLGSGFGSLYEMPILFKKSIQLKQAGNYKFSIQQGMRDTTLVGINDIGLEIIKAE